VDDVIQILTRSRFSEDVYAASLYDSRASIKLKEDVPHIGTWETQFFIFLCIKYTLLLIKLIFHFSIIIEAKLIFLFPSFWV
jgi:hypothetical protein